MDETAKKRHNGKEHTMKYPIIAITASAAVIAALSSQADAASVSSRDVSVPYWGDQQRFNSHIQGQANDQRDMIDHLQRSDDNHNAWTGRQQKQIDGQGERLTSLEGWTDRQEGAIRAINIGQDDQNRRLDAGDARDQRQDGSIDNAHARIGGVIEQANEDRAVIDGNTQRSLGNQKAIGFLQETDAQLSEAITETNQQVTADRSASIERDRALSGRIEDRVAYDGVQDAYAHSTRQQVASIESWSVEQFERHGAAIDANSRAIASERDARQEADRDLQAGIAAAIAAGSHIMDTNYRGLQMSVAGGAYRGASAASLAVGGALTASTFGHISVSHDSRGNQAYGANLNWKL